MNINEIREKYLSYFEQKGHKRLASASLIPENDPTTLFTGSGMQPMVPYLLGESHPEGTRLTDSQKCFRSGDIEEIGDNRHTTFFEMLGNWSLGDYFKNEQIEWIFDFLVNEINLDPSRLYISVYRGNEGLGLEKDTEAAELWKKQFASVGIEAGIVDFAERDGMQDGKIFYYPESENWWSRVGVPEKMPVGEPGGPDSEMFWDFGADLQFHENSEWNDQPCHVACDCGRFFEIGNNVFMQYVKTNDGFNTLPNKNIDFGGGVERLAAANQDVADVFLLTIFDKAREAIQAVSGKSYTDSKDITSAYRVILDHLRAATFLIADGAVPSNKDQGYFTRRLIRRAVRFGHVLEIEEKFCGEIIEGFIEQYKQAYPELETKKGFVLEAVTNEEEKFKKTLQKGLKEFEKLEHQAAITGPQAFQLFATYGFPVEMTQELAAEKGLEVDMPAFTVEMEQHQNLSREGAKQKFAGGLADHSEASTRLHTATHLLHQALKNVLGEEVEQKGSNITPERLRFDFNFDRKLTPEEKQQVEAIVNEQINRELEVSFEELDIEEARKNGAIGLFEDKYGNNVKVYKMGDFSYEICGGPHVKNTKELGSFKIKKEEASSAGVRRIKAVIE